MNSKTSKIIALICCVSLVLSSIISIIDFWCFNGEFYKTEYEQLNTAKSIGMSKEDLDKTTDVLLTYLKDRNNTLEVEANVKGENRQVFNDREIAHMVDVRELYLTTIDVRNVCYIVFAVSLFILFIKKNFKYLFISYKKTLFIFGLIFLIIGIFCAIDFDTFWTGFHKIFFTNDLWLLDPRTDILIMMVPSKFFFDLCVSIVVSVLLVLALYFVIIKILDKKVIKHD